MEEQVRLLMLDDSGDDLDLMERVLRRGGIAFTGRRVHFKPDFETSLSEFSPDVILSDHVLPGFDGFSALAMAREKCPDVPFILVSGVLGEELAIETLKRGATDYVLKSRLSRLVPAVKRALAEKRLREERRKAEGAFRESEAKFAAFADSLPAIIFIHQEGKLCYLNAAAETILDYSRAELVSMYFWEVVHPNFRDRVRQQGLMREGGEAVPSHTQFQILSKNGVVRWLACNACRIEVGGRPAVLGSAIDISEEKLAEQHLLAEHEITRALAESATLTEAAPTILRAVGRSFDWEQGTLWELDAQSHLLRCVETWASPLFSLGQFEEAMRQQTFRLGEGLPGRVWLSGSPESIDDMAARPNCPRAKIALKCGLHRAFAFPIRLQGEVTAVMELFSRQHGAPEPSFFEVVTGLSGQIGQFIARKKAEASLQNSEERFRQVVENIREVFWMTDVEKSHLIYISPGYEDIWGRPVAGHYASPPDWLEAIHSADRQRVLEAAKTKQITGEYHEIYRIIRPDGSTRWIEDRAFPVRNEQGKVYRITGIAEDITERKELASEILRISEREQQRFGQDLHDELCQHLVAVKFKTMALEQMLAKRDTLGAELAERIVGLLNESIQKAYDLAKGLHPVKLEASGLVCALEELAAKTQSRSNLQCSFRFQKNVLLEDKSIGIHLYRIAQEAVSNAIKHARATRLDISLTAQNDRINLAVKDNGIGFASQPNSYGGMGLSIMRYRAEAIGASIRIEPRTNVGTRVLCTIAIRNQKNGERNNHGKDSAQGG